MTHVTLKPAEVRARLAAEPDLVFLDVRSVEEFEQGHVPGAYNIPLLFRTNLGMQPNPAFLAEVERRFARETKLVLGCRSGVRSERACELLAARGYTSLVNLAGGFHGATDPSGRLVEPGWASAGFESRLTAEPGRSHAELR